MLRVNNAWSDSVSVRSGVPQGSVLGLLLYFCYYADLKQVVNHGTLSLYVDDSKLYRAIGQLEDYLLFQRNLNRISKWAKYGQLHLKFWRKLKY